LLDGGLLEGAGEGWYQLHQAIADYARMHRTDLAPLQRLVQYGRELCISQNIEVEYSVVLAALQAAITLSQGQDLLDMLLHLLPFWRTRGYYDQANVLLSTALDKVVVPGDTTMRARLLAERAQFAVVQEKWELAKQCAQTGLELSHQPRIRAQCLQTLGSVALQDGDRVQAKAFYEEGISLARACADRERQSYLLNLLSGLIFQQGDYQQSECLNREGLDLARQEDNAELICSHLASLGIALQMQANYPESERYLREGLQLTRQLNYPLLQARMFMNLAVTVCEQGDWAQSELLLREGLALARRMDDPRTVRRFLMNLGEIAIEQEDYDQAEQYIREGLTQEPQTIDINSRGMLLAGLGIVLGKKGVIEEAHAVFEECVGIAHNLGNPWLLSGALRSWGDVYLQANQLDTAEERFQAALLAYRNGQPQPDMIAEAQFGLAKVAALQGRLEDAQKLGEQCLHTFTEIHHRTTHEVQEWLTTLPSGAAKAEVSFHKSSYVVHEEQGTTNLVDSEEVQHQPLCPYCHKQDMVRKRGKNRTGNQRYHCLSCQHDFTLSNRKTSARSQPLAKMQVRELAHQGLSARAIARQVGIHHTTVVRWLGKS
jgi:tetratricopeptide (TPR) repeat protein